MAAFSCVNLPDFFFNLNGSNYRKYGSLMTGHMTERSLFVSNPGRKQFIKFTLCPTARVHRALREAKRWSHTMKKKKPYYQE